MQSIIAANKTYVLKILLNPKGYAYFQHHIPYSPCEIQLVEISNSIFDKQIC